MPVASRRAAYELDFADARQFHVYAAERRPEHVAFLIDDHLIKTVQQSQSYPMRLMLSIYEFEEPTDREPTTGTYPKELVVDYVRGYRPTA